MHEKKKEYIHKLLTDLRTYIIQTLKCYIVKMLRIT